jgi:hypothetical protein
VGIVWLAFGAPLTGAEQKDETAELPRPDGSEMVAVASGGTVAGEASPPPDIRYGRDIRPLLSDRCFNCHGQDPETRAAGLRLDDRDEAIAERGGVRAIVPGDAEASELWKRITSHNPDGRMPPPEAQKRPLTDEDLETIRSWIEQGAPYEPHWAFEPPVSHDPPPVALGEWPRDAIDRFVLARMEAEGVDPAPEADPGTLLRRAFLDLTGLPPTPEELDVFLADLEREGDDAYDRWVDRLLSEEPYVTRVAERLTVPWLDAARYADTIGIHTDAGRQMWLWRDWVIDAFRSNMPYDRFITEQLAGDLIPGATVQQRVASGFNRSHVITDEGGAIDEEYLVEYAVDRTDTASSVFLGLTMSCARCHDHKYDPISAEDYYGLLAYFNSNDEPGLYSQQRNANRAFEPSLAVPTAEQRGVLARLKAEIVSLSAQAESPGEDVRAALEAFFGDAAASAAWFTPGVEDATSEGGATMEVLGDGSVRATGENPFDDTYELTLASDIPLAGVNTVLIEALPGDDSATGRAGRASNGNAVLTGLEFRLDNAEGSETIDAAWAWADTEQAPEGFPAIDALTPGPDTGWGIGGQKTEGGRALLVVLAEPVELGVGDRLTVRMAFESEWSGHAFARVRTSLGAVEPPEGLFPVFGTWHRMPAFDGPAAGELFGTEFGPETLTALDLADTFGDDEHRWMPARDIRDGSVNVLPGPDPQVHYFAREVFAPEPVETPVSIGSDDGFRLYVNGTLVAENNTAAGCRARPGLGDPAARCGAKPRCDEDRQHRGPRWAVLQPRSPGGVDQRPRRGRPPGAAPGRAASGAGRRGVAPLARLADRKGVRQAR